MKNDITEQKTTLQSLLIGKCYQYHLKGLTAKEIGKLLDLSERTVQRWAKDGNFKELAAPTTLQTKAVALYNKGLSYSQIAATLNVCKTTVYNYLKVSKVK